MTASLATIEALHLMAVVRPHQYGALSVYLQSVLMHQTFSSRMLVFLNRYELSAIVRGRM